MRRTALPASLAVLIATLVLASAGCASTPAGVDGQSLVLSKCVRCHTIDRVRAKAGADRDAWTVSVTRMQGHGLRITDVEKTRIIEFLASGKAF